MNWKIFEASSFPLDEKLKLQIEHFYQLLIKENEKYNLTRITDQDEMMAKHFLDSLLFTQDLKLVDQKVVDIGSGAGFPGLVLKLFYPNLDITLVEANQKKAKFLALVIDKLQLKKVKVVNQRAEDYARLNRNQFDFVVSRAVATLRILLELGAPLLKSDGTLIALKGPKVSEEMRLIQSLDDKLGLDFDHQQVIKNYDYGERINLFYCKKRATPDIYPRPYHVIKKEINNLGKK